jgi:hypothetical protein
VNGDEKVRHDPTAPEFVRYWTKADKVGFWREMACQLMTQSGQSIGVNKWR